MKTVYAICYHGDVQPDKPLFWSEAAAEQYRSEKAAGCYVEKMKLIEYEGELEAVLL